MGIREEIKSYIVRSGMTMTEVVDRLYDDYDWSRSVPNLSGKLRRASLSYEQPPRKRPERSRGACGCAGL